eukprot:5234742-Amphidinium_carterae.2
MARFVAWLLGASGLVMKHMYNKRESDLMTSDHAWSWSLSSPPYFEEKGEGEDSSHYVLSFCDSQSSHGALADRYIVDDVSASRCTKVLLCNVQELARVGDATAEVTHPWGETSLVGIGARLRDATAEATHPWGETSL